MFWECSRCAEQHANSENADKCCGALKERDRIVAWLRMFEDEYGEMHMSGMIEAGEHWK